MADIGEVKKAGGELVQAVDRVAERQTTAADSIVQAAGALALVRSALADLRTGITQMEDSLGDAYANLDPLNSARDLEVIRQRAPVFEGAGDEAAGTMRDCARFANEVDSNGQSIEAVARASDGLAGLFMSQLNAAEVYLDQLEASGAVAEAARSTAELGASISENAGSYSSRI